MSNNNLRDALAFSHGDRVNNELPGYQHEKDPAILAATDGFKCGWDKAVELGVVGNIDAEREALLIKLAQAKAMLERLSVSHTVACTSLACFATCREGMRLNLLKQWEKK